MKPACILVTDDERGIRLTIRTALESEGYNVLEAADGRAALDTIQSRGPDLVVLDLNMPVLDGMAVLEELKKLATLNRPRVIVLTAYGSIPAAVKATRLGAVDFLEKPITPSELRKTVRSVLDEQEMDCPPAVVPEIPGGYERVLDRIRKTLRLADYETAETLLTKVSHRKDRQAAPYYNLMGVLYEAQRRWWLARKCYMKALDADAKHEPARMNLQRLAELREFGRSTRPVCLGDENDDVMFAHLPEPTRHEP